MPNEEKSIEALELGAALKDQREPAGILRQETTGAQCPVQSGSHQYPTPNLYTRDIEGNYHSYISPLGLELGAEWVRVPREATEEMLRAACNWRDEMIIVGFDTRPSMNDQYRALYKAMIVAAQKED